MRDKETLKKWLLVIWTVFYLAFLAGCQSAAIKDPVRVPSLSPSVSGGENAPDQIQNNQPTHEIGNTQVMVKKGQSYSTKDEVAAYIKKFHELPPNYITKKEAQKLGWDNSQGNLWEISDQKSIGGDSFGNREGLLPKAAGRQYYECDVNYFGGYRGAERLVYSNDGFIYYSGDHYTTFIKLD